MDPDATLRVLIDAAVSGDYGTVRQASDDLVSWLVSGGFPPSDPRNVDHQ